jgi:hypothetical protein
VPKKKKAATVSNNPNEPIEESKEDQTENEDIIDPNDDIFVGEQNGENIYISKHALKDSIAHSQVLSALLYESEKKLSTEQKTQMDEVIKR